MKYKHALVYAHDIQRLLAYCQESLLTIEHDPITPNDPPVIKRSRPGQLLRFNSFYACLHWPLYAGRDIEAYIPSQEELLETLKSLIENQP